MDHKKPIFSQNKKRDSHRESLLHSIHETTIEKMAIGGSGVCRIPFLDQKIVCFVPKSAPHDHVKIKINSVEKNYTTGEILEIINPGPGRRLAPCAHYQDCGGCAWQHLNEDIQIQQKELLLRELIAKFLPNHKDYKLKPTIFDEHNFGYRNRIQLKQIGHSIGYFKPESHDLVDISDCLIAENSLRDWFKNNKNKLKPTDKLKKYELKIDHDNKIQFYPIGVKSEGLSFSQVNRFINHKLVQSVVETVSLYHPQTITELYAGSGNFTFELAKISSQIKIDAVELNAELTNIATKRVLSEKLQKNIRFYTTKSELFAVQNEISNELIFLDPPRQGCEQLLLRSLAQKSPQRILYVSCHPVSLVRDLSYLEKQGYTFKIDYFQIFDMFPQTDHFETVCLIERV